jgi:putative FmdB family regulatory protein
MPTYQYRCTACDRELEVVQKFTDDPLTDCPECDGNLRKVFNAVGVVFKGSGFYATDNRTKGKTAAARAGEKPDSEPATEIRPAAQARPKADAKPSSTGASSAA